MSQNSSVPVCHSLISGSAPSLFTLDTMYCQMHVCVASSLGSVTLLTFSCINAVLRFPLNALVLVLGGKRWRRRAAASNVDVFAYNMSAIELIGILGGLLASGGVHQGVVELVVQGLQVTCVSTPAHMLFHTLTCGEHYCAVVRPLAYQRLRSAAWLRLRNLVVGGVWLLSLSWSWFLHLPAVTFAVLTFGLSCAVLLLIAFFCVSVLFALTRPGPGAGGRPCPDQAKLRALRAMALIMAVLLLKFGGEAGAAALMPRLSRAQNCFLWLSVLWFGLPSALVLPLQLLHRTARSP